MPTITVSDDTYRKLAAKAALLNRTVEEVVAPALEHAAAPPDDPANNGLPLTGDAWKREREEWVREVRTRSHMDPPGFLPDDGRGLSDQAPPPTPHATEQLPLTGDARKRAREEWVREARARSHMYPPGFEVDCSRETIYEDR